MSIHRPNPQLDTLLEQERRLLTLKKSFVRKTMEGGDRMLPCLHDPVLGEYFCFAWDGIFDAQKEIMLTVDGYAPNAPYMYHSHDFFEIVYVYAGHCQTNVAGHPTELSAGDICLYDLRAIHKMEFTEPEDTIFNIIVRKDLFRRILLELLAESDVLSAFFINSLYNRENTGSCILVKADAAYRCEVLAQRIAETFFQKQPMSQSTIKSLLILLLTEIARQHKEEHIQRSQGILGSLDIADLILYISNHYHSLSLEDTARHFGYSTRSITRFLLRNTGHSFREILQDVRFSHARSMLQESPLSIDEISQTTGYRNRSSFENAFKKHCHTTPAAYRKQFRTE